MKSIKWIMKHVVPVMLSLAIVVCVVVYDHEKVRATGMEEVLYYTYWDLISSLGYACGYDVDMKADYDNSNTISGKDVWDAFCDFISYKPMADYEQDYIDSAMAELQALPNNATADGISISQDLYDWLCDIFAITAGDTTNSISTNIAQYANISDVVPFGYSGCVNSTNYDHVLHFGISVSEGDARFCYTYGGYYDTVSYYIVYPGNVLFNFNADDGSTYSATAVTALNQCNTYNGYCYFKFFEVHRAVSYTPLGTKVSSITSYINSLPTVVNSMVDLKDAIDSQKVADHPDSVADSIPWVVATQYWEIERTQTDTGSSSDPDPDKDEKEKKDRLPVVIPFVWPSTDPDNSEEETESESESESETTGTGTDTDPDTDTDTDTDIDEETLTDTVNSVLGNSGKITQLFPFCIPFDIVSMIKGMKSAKKAPVWHFEYYFKEIDYTFEFTVDMSDYEQYIKIFRAGFVIFYVITLMLLTIRYSSGIVKD